MNRKKVADLQPLKITKTEANTQTLLLEMMSKLVAEQRESNRLLRKISGETVPSHTPSKVSLFQSPTKRQGDSIISYNPNRDHQNNDLY